MVQTTSPLMEVRNLVKRFRGPHWGQWVWAVNNVSLTLRRGETLGLVGESGSGKTTVGRCLLRLLDPTAGQILLDGDDITDLRQREVRRLRSRVQVVFQEPYDSLDPRKTIGEAIREPLDFIGSYGPAKRDAMVEEVADLVRIPAEALKRFPHEMSAGVLQQAGIARAMVCEPELIVLDEPTSLLDATARAGIIALLNDIQARTGVSYLFISHDLTTVARVSHRVAVMYLGKVVEMGSREQIFSRPIHPYTRSLLSAVLEPYPNLRQETTPLVGEIPSPIDLPSGCSLHSRCPVAIASCSTVVPQLVDIGEGHEVSCIRLAPFETNLVEGDQRIMWAEQRGFRFNIAPNGHEEAVTGGE